MIRVGIVGHRFLNEYQAVFVARECYTILKQMQEVYNNVIAYSAIAAGADSIFAEAALQLNIPLEIVLPFDEYEFDFTEETTRQIYLRLKAAATVQTNLKHSARSEDAYAEAMQWILHKSDIVIAVWSGDTTGGRGGTADAVKKMVDRNLDWIHLDISQSSITAHLERNKLIAL